MPLSTLSISFLSIVLLLFLFSHILFPPIFVSAASSRFPSCPSSPFTLQQQQHPADSLLDSIPTPPASVPRPTYAPHSGRSLTRCQGLVPEMKVSAYLNLALACLTNTTFQHEHICIDNLCDGILLHVPDNPSIIQKHLQEAVMMESEWDEEEEEEEERARDHNRNPQDRKRGGGGNDADRPHQRLEETRGRTAGGPMTTTMTMAMIPSMETPLWLRCSHRYLPRHLLTQMAREHARQRRNRIIRWTLLTLGLIGLLGLGFCVPRRRRLLLLLREPVEFAEEGTDAARRKRYLLRTRIYLPVPRGWARWLGCEERMPLPWLDRLMWVRRMDVQREVWFKDLEVAFKARRGRQG